MLNEDFFDEKDRRILALKMEIKRLRGTVRSFKEYDAKRKEYYKDALIRLGKLEATDEAHEIERLKEELNARDEQIKKLNSQLACVKLNAKSELGDMELAAKVVSLLAEKKNMEQALHRYKETINSLLNRLISCKP